jgi:hypothetical protein
VRWLSQAARTGHQQAATDLDEIRAELAAQPDADLTRDQWGRPRITSGPMWALAKHPPPSRSWRC